jgi:beta-lactamase regulating signal transducer with metallopeptidase domain
VDAASWIERWWAWSAPCALQGALLLALAWLADRLLARRAWPQLLALVWLLALARCFLPPDLSSPLSVTTSLGERTLGAAQFAPGQAFLRAAFALWLAGAVLLLVLRGVQRARLRTSLEFVPHHAGWSEALARAARRLGCRREPRLGTLAGLATPALGGLLRPVLLLPREWLARAPTRRDEHALLHDCAHLVRGDLWRDELCALARALLWFQPLAWIAVARLHALSELACDETVARALGAEARDYRDTLVLAARRLLAHPAPAGLRGFVGRPSALVLRIERLDGGQARPPARVRVASAALACVLLVCVLPMAHAASGLRAQALRILAAQQAGERQSCFSLQAAALVLSADAPDTDSRP